MRRTVERLAEGRFPASSALPHQLGNAIDGFERFLLRDDAFLHEKVQDALAQHQADLAVGIRGWHRALFGYRCPMSQSRMRR
jgi:hypothetical protein